MTTTVNVEAHCASDKQVVVTVKDLVTDAVYETFILQDGEKASRVLYDNRQLLTHEVLK
ncbi:hypothetical protein D3C77_681490 [compost metagenome]